MLFFALIIRGAFPTEQNPGPSVITGRWTRFRWMLRSGGRGRLVPLLSLSLPVSSAAFARDNRASRPEASCPSPEDDNSS
eukprot:995385-Amorphochlora_amoeboformis.AAC.2